MTKKSKTIIFQPSNSVGLGHINRLAAIALAVRSMDPTVHILFVVEGYSHGLLESLGLAEVNIPTDDHILGPAGSLNESPERRQDFALAIYSELLRKLQPDLVLFDSFPATQFAMATHLAQVRMAICLRRVKDFNEYSLSRRLQIVLQHADPIIVPHDEGTLVLPREIQDRAIFVGDIVKPLQILSAEMSTMLEGHSRRWVVITAGGGGAPGTSNFYNLALAAVEQSCRNSEGISGLLITGPLFNDWFDIRVPPCVTLLPYTWEAMSIFARADLVISQSGYNTMAELAILGTPAICVPGERGADDQFQRASEMSAKHLHLSLFKGEDPRELSILISAKLQAPHPIIKGPAARGAELAAKVILSL